MIAYTLFLASYSHGSSSLVVEAAHTPERLVADARRVLRHSGALLTAAVSLLLVAAAPWLLRLFGPGYAEGATDLVRLLALAALPNLLLGVAIDVARARRTLAWAVGLQVALCVLVLGLVRLAAADPSGDRRGRRRLGGRRVPDRPARCC